MKSIVYAIENPSFSPPFSSSYHQINPCHLSPNSKPDKRMDVYDINDDGPMSHRCWSGSKWCQHRKTIRMLSPATTAAPFRSSVSHVLLPKAYKYTRRSAKSVYRYVTEPAARRAKRALKLEPQRPSPGWSGGLAQGEKTKFQNRGSRVTGFNWFWPVKDPFFPWAFYLLGYSKTWFWLDYGMGRPY